MKKYKHKQSGDIAVKDASMYRLLSQGKNSYVPDFIIENTNDWEEIIEKDYEILCYYNQNQIKSVKRLSDNKIFTIGDKVVNVASEKITKIKQFCTEPKIKTLGGLCAFYEDGSFDYLYDVIKFNPILFKTEDGVDIYEGDKYSYINYLDSPFYDVVAHSTHSIKVGMKAFSTREKAEEYILWNKPCLSLKDVSSIYPGINKEHKSPSHQAEQLKELVKSKL